jgi:hypothetical protein
VSDPVASHDAMDSLGDFHLSHSAEPPCAYSWIAAGQLSKGGSLLSRDSWLEPTIRTLGPCVSLGR